MSLTQKYLNIRINVFDEQNIIYRVPRGTLASIESVYGRGVELIIDGDDPELDVLILKKIDFGHVRTCVVRGLVRFAAPVDDPITVDATGWNLGEPYTFCKSELAGCARNQLFLG